MDAETESQSEHPFRTCPRGPPALDFQSKALIHRPATEPSCPNHRAVSLRHLPQGQPARVVQLRGQRFRPGCCFELVRCGNPCIVRMDGTRFCLRTGRRLDVLVEPLDQTPAADDCPTELAHPTLFTE